MWVDLGDMGRVYMVDSENYVFCFCQVCGSNVLKSIYNDQETWNCEHGPDEQIGIQGDEFSLEEGIRNNNCY